jgi:hypothetical protein
MKFTHIALSVSLACSAAGCDSASTPDATLPATTAAPSGNGTAATARSSAIKTLVSSDNGMLSVDPGLIDLCTHQDGTVEADVKWDATSAKTEGVQVFFEGLDGNKKLWASGGATGSGQMGHWLQAGTQVVMVNSHDNQELARVKLSSVPCAL